MDHAQRRIFTAVVVFILLVSLLPLSTLGSASVAQATTAKHVSEQSQQAPRCYQCYYFYGSNYNWMYTATGDWYLQEGNWCGIASIGHYKALFFMDVELRHGNSITPAFTQQAKQDAGYFLGMMQSFVYSG
jgi:hypothetical protein